MSDPSQVRADLKARTDVIEEAYEFFLAYASQGLPTDANTSHPIRDHLRKFDQALTGIGGFFLDCAKQLGAPDLAAAVRVKFFEPFKPPPKAPDSSGTPPATSA